MITVAVGSKNPVKIEATRQAFTRVWPEEIFKFKPTEVRSGVGIQPRNPEESIEGATNRAKRAQEAMDSDYGVGLEGGLDWMAGGRFEEGWVVIVNRAGTVALACSVKVPVPDFMFDEIHYADYSTELGDVMDQVFGRTNAKQEEGYFGLITQGRITRTGAYADAVVAALTRFVNKELFERSMFR